MKAIKFGVFISALLTATSVFALEIKPYSADTFAQMQSAGQPVALHFHADWCPTCRAQEKVFNSWKGNASVPGTLLVVDYDKARDLRMKFNVRTQSTLIVFKGQTEVARVAGKSDEKSLKDALMK